jgi:hypothetical protein
VIIEWRGIVALEHFWHMDYICVDRLNLPIKVLGGQLLCLCVCGGGGTRRHLYSVGFLPNGVTMEERLVFPHLFDQ